MQKGKPRVAVFIDGENLRLTLGVIGRWAIDWKSFIHFLEWELEGNVKEAHYYGAEKVNGVDRNNSYFDSLILSNINVVKIPSKWKYVNGAPKIICQADPYITTDMIDVQDDFDVVVLVSGDGDFLAPLELLYKRKKSVCIISSSDQLSSDLQNGKFKIFDLKEIKRFIRLY